LPTFGRREFLRNSAALAPAAEGALFARSARAEATADTQRGGFFRGFKTEQIKTSGATIKTVYGGNQRGAPLLLLHGIPETHVLWRKVAPALAQDYFVVMTNLRGLSDTIHAICEDYRAAASIDLSHDKADLDTKFRLPPAPSGASGEEETIRRGLEEEPHLVGGLEA